MRLSDKGAPRVVIISGPDGSGKTTQAMILVKSLRNRGVSSSYKWIRFIHLSSLPLLAFARMRGYTHYETLPNGRRSGQHAFWKSKMVTNAYPHLLFLDMMIAKAIYLDIPSWLLGRTVVCDRFTLDTIVDVMIDTKGRSFHTSKIGLKLLQLIPRESVNVVLTTDLDTILARRPDLVGDKTLSERIRLYAILARDLGFKCIDGSRSVKEVEEDLWKSTFDCAERAVEVSGQMKGRGAE